MRCVVTGGSGFIGSHLVDWLKKEGHEVLVIDLPKPHRQDVEWEAIDILDFPSLLSATKGADYIFHLAAVSNVNYVYKRPVYSTQVNIVGTVNLLEVARLNGIRRFFFASTVWVYGAAKEEENLSEDILLNIADTGHIYTTTKIASEALIHNYWQLYKVPFTILRYGIPYGPRMREELVIPIFVRKALRGEPITIQGDGSQYRNYIYIDDLIRGHILAMSERAENQTYNLEGPRKITIREIAETIKEIIGSQVEIKYVEARPGDFKGRTASFEKAEKELGWKPEIDFKEGMQRYIEWYKAREDIWKV
ncbi:MAG: NAD-dependent epimerase/dehydratase family protein [bacterium]